MHFWDSDHTPVVDNVTVRAAMQDDHTMVGLFVKKRKPSNKSDVDGLQKVIERLEAFQNRKHIHEGSTSAGPSLKQRFRLI